MSRRSRFLAQSAGVFVTVLGGVALVGWWLNSETMKCIVPGSAPLKPNVAAGFLLCGLGVVLLSRKTITRPTHKSAIAIAAAVVLMAALTLGEHFFGWDLPIEQWLIGNAWPDQRILHPGRMASVTALAFLLGGSALLAKSLFVRKQLHVPLVVGLSAALLLMGAIPLAAFLLEILFGSQWNFMGMGLSGTVGAIGFMLLGSGLLALLQSEGHLAWSLDAWTTSGFGLGFLLIVVAAAAGFNFTLHMVETSNRVTHRHEILKETAKVLRGIASLVSSERVYVIIGDEQFLNDRKATKTALDEDIHQLRTLTHDNPNQQHRLDRLEPLITQRIDWEERVIIARRQEGPDAASRMIATGTGLQLSNEILRITKEIEAEEYSSLEANRKSSDSAVSTAFALLPTGAFLSLSILALSAFFLNAGVTERVQAEKALRQSEERYRTLFESNPNPMWVYDLETFSFLAVNAAAVRHYGYSQEEFLAMTLQDIRPPEDIPDVMDDLSRSTGGLSKPNEWRHRKKDGDLIDVEITSNELFWLGRRARVVLVNDITERKRAEERLHEQTEIINRAQDAIIIRDFKDQRITFWNSGAERLYGWKANEVIDRSIGDVMYVDPKDREGPLQTLIAAGEFRGELKQVTKDGREVIVEGRATIVRNPDGTPRSVLSINTDITEQKKLETHLLRSQRLESIGTLASGVAHDLNNILTPILMCAQTLRGDLGEADRQSAISLIEQSAHRGAEVVKQVLTFARGVEGKRVLIKPSHLIEEMIDIARKTFPQSIDISSQYPEDLWSLEGDPTQLHQVLLNFSINARDAMPEGGSVVIAAENFNVDEQYASMAPEAKPGPHVLLRVTDTGQGMPRQVLDKIFDPFFTTKEVGKGTGLGLSTAIGIVKSHRGFISVYSEVGRGTTFKIFLPAKVGDEAWRESETPMESLKGNGELILVVDDEASILRITQMILEKQNYRVVCASDGPGALSIFAQQADAIKVVLTDIMLPYMDGVALIRAMKQMKPEVAFIAATGQGEHARDSELQSLGVTNLLSKPYDTQKLLETLQSALTPGAK
jgi:PAS domain S-box-containing protein